ncbi:MAG: ATP-binding protein [Dermatophilaceae bacterium]
MSQARGAGMPATPTGPSGILARLGLRARLLTVGIVGVAGALLLGFALLYAALTVSLGRSVDAQATSIAREIAALITAGRLADPVPQYGAQFVQVLDREGRVVAASVTADQLTPVVTAPEREQLARGEVLTIAGSRAALASELRVAGALAGPASSGQLVVAALPTADLDRAGDLLRRLLLIAFPLFLGAMAIIAWRVVGAALRPVDDLRRGASRIGASTDTARTSSHPSGIAPAPERLPVPATHDEIHALATTLNDMLDRLDAARATQRAFVTDAAHELRSPLASIRLQLDVAAHVGDGGSLTTDLLPEIDRLTALVEDLLTLARAGDVPPAPAEAVPIGSFLTEVAQRYAAARVPVTAPDLTAVPGGLTAYLPRGDLVRAVTNLVDNAVRHARTGVTLTAYPVGGQGDPPRVEMVVSDDGHGIPEEDRERVFDRFARLDEARARDAGGSGLGLAIARELVHRSGGDIRLADAAPGLRAVVSLPSAPHPA